ncbi:MAG: cysteine hydrolase [Pigmentiphaga sp.]|nr:cysteine hydrolase [Pigmentiphaga sp.]
MGSEIDQTLAAISRLDHLGGRPALLCIDNSNAVFGDTPEPLEAMVKRFPFGCGMAAWDALEPTKALLQAFRQRRLPIIHSALDHNPTPDRFRIAGIKGAAKVVMSTRDRAWMPELTPLDDELRIYKRCASVFFGTALTTHLQYAGVDTLIVCGNTTSGCVRATVVDAFSLGYKVGVVEECVFDRNTVSHQVNLYDMHFKYANVMRLDDVIPYLEGELQKAGAR